MNNNKLFQDAIADAKAVREAALANAKAVLEETFTPRLQSMLSAKLNEMEDDENQEMEEGYEPSNEDESFDISEILAELDNEELEEAKKDDKEEEEKEEDETEAEDDETKEEDEAEEEAVEVKDMTVDELTSLIKDIVSQEMNTGEESMGDEMGDMGDMSNVGGETEDNLDMDSIETSEENDEELDLEELLAELDALDNTPEELGEVKKVTKKDNKELKEAVNTIQILRKELNEVNLLNSKLLYVNKIFKSKNLSESQKIHVISSFDKAKTTKEAKLVYESLIVNLQPKKQAIKESIGFASKATGIAPKKQIIESSDIVTRMQRLANIIK